MLERVDEIRFAMDFDPANGRAELEHELNELGLQTSDDSTGVVAQMLACGELLQNLTAKPEANE